LKSRPGQKFGLPTRQAEDRSHTFFVKKVISAPEQSELAEVHQRGHVFITGTEIVKKDRNGEAAFARGIAPRLKRRTIGVLPAACDLSAPAKTKKPM